jgi:hypothetical protein
MKFDNLISFDSRGLAAEEYQRLSGEPVRRDANVKICKKGVKPTGDSGNPIV